MESHIGSGPATRVFEEDNTFRLRGWNVYAISSAPARDCVQCSLKWTHVEAAVYTFANSDPDTDVICVFSVPDRGFHDAIDLLHQSRQVDGE